MRALPALAVLLLLAGCADPEAPAEVAPADRPAPAVAAESGGGAEAAVPGRPAPAFTLVGTDGAERSLADYRGQTVVLEWLNYDCPFVGKHYGGGAMQALQAQAAADGVVWLSVVSSAPGEQGHFEPAAMDARTESEGGRQAAVLLDADGAVGRRYGAVTTPHMFVVDADGTLVYNGAIDDTPTTDPADLATATGYVTPAIAAARAGRPADPARTQPYGCSVKYGDGA
ncbi:redoxin family protein [Rubrivirga sp. S365]|uniref:redoxin family protein n=1 Tax=Rubrivirga sp. S365 TaxID=3076080 RepID=UPI0028C61F2E|nr:redoxin family protein [Rubrivirga sp. S365]MDT7857412.1 redoxin family protein [Rubrivirga sp. S365]